VPDLLVQEAIAMAIGSRPTFMGTPAEFVATWIGMTRPLPEERPPQQHSEQHSERYARTHPAEYARVEHVDRLAVRLTASRAGIFPAGARVISQEAVLAAPLLGVVTFTGDGCLPVPVGGHRVQN
jgi:hypothetical protein